MLGIQPVSIILCFALVLLSACSSVRVSDYESMRPLLKTEAFFDGKLSAHGVLKDRSGKVIRTFNADIKAYWQDGVGTLEEDFVFDDGEEQRRVWTLVPNGEGRYIGTAGDVIGESAIEVSGNSMFLDYVLRVPYGDGTIDVTIDDRMYLVSPTVLINESTLSKWGFNVGSLLLVIEKRSN
mgnify:CR=1 FL=1